MFAYACDAFHRLTADFAKAATQAFAELCRGANAGAFTRKRKMPLVSLIQTLICRKGRSLALELRDYMARAFPGEGISKQGYLKQRMKLNPHAILELVRYHNQNFYADGAGRTFDGHLVLAVDGTSIHIPSTQENIKTYGTSGRKGRHPQAALGLSCLCDVLNGMVLDASIHRSGFDERAAAREHLAGAPDVIGDLPFIATMDRGYSSAPFFLWMSGQGISFVARLKSTDFREEISGMASDDGDVVIPFTKARIAHHRGKPSGALMSGAGSMRLRIVRVRPKDGKEEILATNLPREKFGTWAIGELYRLRWGVETTFGKLKDCLQIENLTGKKPTLILQDIFATIYVSNLAADILLEADREIEANERKREKPRKNKVAANRRVAIGILKDDMIRALLEDDPDAKELLFMRMYKDILGNVVPVRPGRSYPRRKGLSASKFPVTHKRSF